LWFPCLIELADENAVRDFFDEVIADWIRPSPQRPYLLVNFANLHIRANMVDDYAKNIARFQSMVLGTYRYGMPPSFTGVAVALGNWRLRRTSSLTSTARERRSAWPSGRRIDRSHPLVGGGKRRRAAERRLRGADHGQTWRRPSTRISVLPPPLSNRHQWLRSTFPLVASPSPFAP
jgi:hypothetical protein